MFLLGKKLNYLGDFILNALQFIYLNLMYLFNKINKLATKLAYSIMNIQIIPQIP